MSSKTKNVLKVIFYSLIVIVLAMFGSMGSKEYYGTLNLPKGAPPAWVFPVAWGIIYTLMIVSAIIIVLKAKDGMYKKDAISFYYTQALVNAFWPYLFFVFKTPLLAFLWLILLLVLVVLTALKFYNLNKTAGYLFIPYILWLLYAGYINLFVIFLN